MPTHQSLAGVSDQQLLERMVSTHAERFDAAYWTLHTTHVAPRLPPNPVIVDLGCGPALLLRDLSARHPTATLHGYDVTEAMIDHGRRIAYPGPTPALELPVRLASFAEADAIIPSPGGLTTRHFSRGAHLATPGAEYKLEAQASESIGGGSRLARAPEKLTR